MSRSSINIPRKLPLLIVSDQILLPGTSMRISVGTSRNISLVKNHVLRNSTLSSIIIGVVPRQPLPQPGQDVPTPREDLRGLHSVGTAAMVVQVAGSSWPEPSYSLLVTGLCRFRLDRISQEMPYLIGSVTQLEMLPTDDSDLANTNPELEALITRFKEQTNKLLDMLDVSIPFVSKIRRLMDVLPAHHLADLCAGIISTTYGEKLDILDAVDITERFKKVLPLLARQIEGYRLLQRNRKNNISRAMTFIPKQPVKRLTSDKIEDDDFDETDDVSDLENKLRAAKLPTHARKVAVKELNRLKKMTAQSPEYAMTRNYVELMAELPWNRTSPETLDIHKARIDLDTDHYAMEKLKRRVLEYLAVRQLRNSLKGPILCFVGPPGVGKTSVGRSIAQTLGREFHRISLGGVCDQSDIRGHRRTYIGSMPGRIIQGLKNVGVNNPVFLLDEIDKMSSGIHGDPAAALLEVLDPEQNCNFVDHYLNVSFDLSQVMFIATANTTATIPAALLDRMEIIHVPGYTQEEKLHIATRHLLPKQYKEHGLTQEMIQIPEPSLKMLISSYTREAGVRSLERKMGALCRAVAVKVATSKHASPTMQEGTGEEQPVEASKVIPVEHTRDPMILDEAAVEDILGPPPFDNEFAGRLSQPGVAIGLAWTAVGGEVMFVEATKMEGTGELMLTGQLGDVMKESAWLALNWVRTHAREYDIRMDGDLMMQTDVHIHFPAGAVGKDGPSAGVTIVTVLMSLFSGRCVLSDIAMTGEVTLRGVVLPVGGIKEKVLAAHRHGIKRVILPRRSKKELQEVPESVRKEMTFILVSHVDEVLQAAFDGGFPVPFSKLESKL